MNLAILHELAGRRDLELREVNEQIALVDLSHRSMDHAYKRLRQKRLKSTIQRRRKHEPVGTDEDEYSSSLLQVHHAVASPSTTSADHARLRNKLELERRMEEERSQHEHLMGEANLRFAAARKEREMAIEREFEANYQKRLEPAPGRLRLERSFNTPSPMRQNRKFDQRRLPPISKTPEPFESAHSLLLKIKHRASPDASPEQLRTMMKKHVVSSIASQNRRQVLERLSAARVLEDLEEKEISIQRKGADLSLRLHEAGTSASHTFSSKRYPRRSRGDGEMTATQLLEDTIFQENVRKTVWCTNREVDRWHEARLEEDLVFLQANRALEAANACQYYKHRVDEAQGARIEFLSRNSAICDSLATLCSGAAAKAFRVSKSSTSKRVPLRVLVAALKKLHRSPTVSCIISALEQNFREVDLRGAGAVSFDDLLCLRSVLNASDYISGIRLHGMQIEDDMCWKVVATLPKDFVCVTKVVVDESGVGDSADQVDASACSEPPQHLQSSRTQNPYANFAADMARRNREVALFEHGLGVSQRQASELARLEAMDVVHLAHVRRRMMMSFQCMAMALGAHETFLRELVELFEMFFRRLCELQLRHTWSVLLAGGAEWRARRAKLSEEELCVRRALETLMLRNVTLLEKEFSSILIALKRSGSVRNFRKAASVTTFAGWRPSKKAPTAEVTVVPSSITAEVELVSATSFAVPIAADIAVEQSNSDIRCVHSSSGLRPSSRLGAGSAPIVHLQVEPMNE